MYSRDDAAPIKYWLNAVVNGAVFGGFVLLGLWGIEARQRWGETVERMLLASTAASLIHAFVNRKKQPKQ